MLRTQTKASFYAVANNFAKLLFRTYVEVNEILQSIVLGDKTTISSSKHL